MKQYLDPLQQDAHEAFFVVGRESPPEVLPPSRSKEEFLRALSELREICGSGNVITGSDLVSFVDPFAVNTDHIPSAAVCPANVEETQAVVKTLNRHKIPAWTCSRGKNLGYGGPAPVISGSIVLSLHRMASIIEVNEKNAYAVVEPGVSFRDLSQYCLNHKPSVWPNMPSIGWGSVIGNALDRGIGYNALGDHHHNISGLEVILPDGTLLRTGQWAASNSPTTHLCKNSFGPNLEGLFLQSNLGIVTKMSLWLQPRPQTYMAVKVEVNAFEDIAPLIDALGTLHREDILQNNPLIGDVLGMLSSRYSAAQLHDRPGAIPDEIISELKDKHGLGAWTAIFDFYGTKAMVQARFERCQEVVRSHCANAKINQRFTEPSEGETFVDARTIAAIGRGEPAGIVGTATSVGGNSNMINFALPPDGNGHGAHTDYVPLMPNDGAFILKWFTQARKIMVGHGFNALLGGRVFKKHSLAIQMMFYNSKDESHRKRLKAMWMDLARKGEEHGLTCYRSHLDYMDYCQSAFDFNNHAYQQFVESLKDKLDPNGILSPGKQGIWPEAWRRFSRSETQGAKTNGEDKIQNDTA